MNHDLSLITSIVDLGCPVFQVNNFFPFVPFVHQVINKLVVAEATLKLTQVELFSFFHFKCVAVNASKLFCMVHLAKIECF